MSCLSHCYVLVAVLPPAFKPYSWFITGYYLLSFTTSEKKRQILYEHYFCVKYSYWLLFGLLRRKICLLSSAHFLFLSMDLDHMIPPKLSQYSTFSYWLCNARAAMKLILILFSNSREALNWQWIVSSSLWISSGLRLAKYFLKVMQNYKCIIECYKKCKHFTRNNPWNNPIWIPRTARDHVKNRMCR